MEVRNGYKSGLTIDIPYMERHWKNRSFLLQRNRGVLKQHRLPEGMIIKLVDKGLFGTIGVHSTNNQRINPVSAQVRIANGKTHLITALPYQISAADLLQTFGRLL